MSNTDAHEETLFGHPKGLYVLFFTEMWERFSYYGMRALLTLYMYSTAEGALGWEKDQALALYGWYTMMVYVASVPGGLLADRLLGQKKCVMLGGLLLCVGHGVMAIPEMWAFYSALTLIVLGVGLLKPNISTMVGGLYGPGDARRDKGFSIFYMGINVGAAASALIVGLVAKKWGWHYGFGLAGIGMALGQFQFMLGQRHLRHVGNFVKSDAKAKRETPASKLSKVERDRVFVLLVSFMIVIIFWGAFEQAGGLMSIYTEEKVDRVLGGFEIPAAVFQSINPIFIILFATAVAGYWHNRLARGKQASAVFKMAVGTMIMGLGFIFMVLAANEGSTEEEFGVRVRTAVIEAGVPSPDTTFWMLAFDARTQAKKIAEEQGADKPSIEAAGNDAIAPLIEAETTRIVAQFDNPEEFDRYLSAVTDGVTSVAGLPERLPATTEQARNKAHAKVAEASYRSAVRASTAMWWLFLAYFFHTIGELCSSPVALSFITKLSPAKYASLMMGLYFACTGLGNKVAGLVGEQVEHFSEFAIFSGITVFTVLFSAVLLVFLKPLNRLTHGAEDISKVIDEG